MIEVATVAQLVEQHVGHERGGEKDERAIEADRSVRAAAAPARALAAYRDAPHVDPEAGREVAQPGLENSSGAPVEPAPKCRAKRVDVVERTAHDERPCAGLRHRRPRPGAVLVGDAEELAGREQFDRRRRPGGELDRQSAEASGRPVEPGSLLLDEAWDLRDVEMERHDDGETFVWAQAKSGVAGPGAAPHPVGGESFVGLIAAHVRKLPAVVFATTAPGASRQSWSGRIGAAIKAGLFFQSIPGTSMNNSISLPSGSST